MADILNRSGILEKRGIVLLPKQTGNHIFLDKSKYNDSEDKKRVRICGGADIFD
jgi:hypothetical protein